jgi:hypothetical protein
MSVLLASSYTETAPNHDGITVQNASLVTGSNSGYVLEFSREPSNMFIGAYFTTVSLGTNVTFMIVASTNSDGTVKTLFDPSSRYYLVDTLVTSVTLTTILYKSITTAIHPLGSATVQDILQLFLTTVTKVNYSFVIASLIQVINSDTAFYGNGGGRILCTIDDGSVFIDTSKFLALDNQVYSANVCTFQNFNNKIKIANTLSNLNGSNAFSVNPTGTLTVGSAGGNNINENHNTRPEVLLALLSNGGVANAIRYSTSTSTVNFYYAIRFGPVAENNIGTVRINVPATVSIA